MKDWEYLSKAIELGYLCPGCGQRFLTLEPDIGGVCSGCSEIYPSWASLLIAGVREAETGKSPDEVWREWLLAHPDYGE